MTNARWMQRGFTPLKRYLPRAVWQSVRALATGIVTPLRFSLATGHFRSSLSMVAKASNGSPLPWYTYPAIDFLAARNFDGKTILEFGGGQSTLWWSAHAKSVLTIEQDAEWTALLKDKIGSNVTLHHVPIDKKNLSFEGVRALIPAHQKFDVIVVDGHLRREATALAFNHLADDGAIIHDNSEGYEFFEETQNRECKRIDFFGFCPGVSTRSCTSLVYRDDCFLLKPDIPIPVIR
ncbi:class I SAM-dependent methyltransferase [Mesorhizobium prunaredense]|nr:class I SAM-dependent methyltransferase [Mesorhizobium prunaredense]